MNPASFGLHHYNGHHHLFHHQLHAAKHHHRRANHLPQTPFGCKTSCLGEDVASHHTIDLMDTDTSGSTKSGPTLLDVLSQVVDTTRVSCKVKVEPLLETFLTSTSTTAAPMPEVELTGASSCYGTLWYRKWRQANAPTLNLDITARRNKPHCRHCEGLRD